LCLVLLAGAVPVVLLSGPRAFLNSAAPGVRALPTAVVTGTSVQTGPPQLVQLATAEPSQPTPQPSQPTPQPTIASTALATLAPTIAPTAAATPQPTLAPTAAPTQPPTAADVWPATLASLDPIWSTDPARAVAAIEGFLAQFPDYQPATDKQYAALVAYAHVLADAGNVDDAKAQLRRAADLQPERGEALTLMNQLDNPDMSEPRSPDASEVATAPRSATEAAPAPPPVASVTRAAAPQPRPAASTAVPVARPPEPRISAPAAAAPTPTKVPFRPPGG
jgi:hypothetical protein